MERDRIRNMGAERRSHAIKRVPAVNVHHATRYAEMIGRPLNQFVTINLTQASCSDARAVTAFRKLVNERFAPWLRRTPANGESVSPTHVWAVEAAGGQVAVHWLVHVPERLRHAFNAMLSRWVASVTGAMPSEGVIKVKPIYNVVGARRYILKGTDEPWAKHLGVRAVPQGLVIGKRSGFSRNLGPSARAQGGYKPRRMPPKAAG